MQQRFSADELSQEICGGVEERRFSAALHASIMPPGFCPCGPQALKGISTHEVRGHKWPLFHRGDRMLGLTGLPKRERAAGRLGRVWTCPTHPHPCLVEERLFRAASPVPIDFAALAPVAAPLVLKGISSARLRRGHKWLLFPDDRRGLPVARQLSRSNPSGLDEGANRPKEGSARLWNYPTQAKIGIEWATRPSFPGSKSGG